ncbi:OmpW family outer membrane protein [Chryseobacterium limigenitum]|uniref:Outer membrane protein n=1 Tax=Chryseobacterium limigenitum TaxID=1612149 RepID=A0A1K2IDS0_9FLAO|nr:OmpW family outer membrane protein [Chryseobacterium limigenitum]SFZ89843.1 outer membrane protein [Chryseobacterium limigenitum]
MKKLLLAGAVALFGLSNAQMTKGDWVISGSTGFSFNNTTQKQTVGSESADGPKVSTINFTPSVGYFVMDKLAVGIDLDLTSITTKFDVSDISYKSKSTLTNFSVMPTATYYFANGTKFVPYIGAGAGFATNKTKSSETLAGVTDSSDDTASGFTWKVKGGVNYMITQSFALNVGLSYNQFTSKQDIDGTSDQLKNKYNNFGVNAGFSYFIKSKPQKSDK